MRIVRRWWVEGGCSVVGGDVVVGGGGVVVGGGGVVVVDVVGGEKFVSVVGDVGGIFFENGVRSNVVNVFVEFDVVFVEFVVVFVEFVVVFVEFVVAHVAALSVVFVVKFVKIRFVPVIVFMLGIEIGFYFFGIITTNVTSLIIQHNISLISRLIMTEVVECCLVRRGRRCPNLWWRLWYLCL